jgi:Domain of unknown function (DUF1929)/Abnormal spindle-like microcephaly-assoc'd, ASPM-SPD-2-Hydin
VWAWEDVYSRSAFSAVLLPMRPPGYGETVLIVGERQPRKLEVNNAHLGWQRAGAPRPYSARAYATAVLLPDGNVLVVNGGTTERLPRIPPPGDHGGEDKHAVPWAEMYLPDQDQWVTLSAPSYAPIARMYHSVALLLPDGRVWIAGSNHDSDRNIGGKRRDNPALGDARELRVEIYEPPYLFNGVDAAGNPRPADRPVITRTRRGASYGDQFPVYTPNPRQIFTVALLRVASVTHAFSSDQRYVQLEIVRRTDDAVIVEAPPSSRVAPPGYYMLFVLTLGERPSVASMVRIGHRYPLLNLLVRTESMPFFGDFGQYFLPGEPPPGDLQLPLGSKRPGEQVTAVVRAKNVGTGTLEVSDVRVSGGFRTETTGGGIFGDPVIPKNTELVVSPASGAGPGGWVDITLTHTAEAYGTTSGNLEFITTAEDAGYVKLALTLTVEGLELRVPGSLAFGPVAAGMQSRMDLELQNVGTVPAFLSDITVSAQQPAEQFDVPFTLPDRELPVSGTLRVPVWFTPTDVGDAVATLTVTVDGTPAPSRWHESYDVALTGTGVGGRPVLVPDRLDFPDQRVRTTSQSRQVRIRNEGNGPLTVTQVRCGLDFDCTSQCSGPVQPGATCDIDVAFAPAHGGPLVDTLFVDTDAPGGPATAQLTGTGLLEPLVVTAPTPLTFPVRPVGVGGPPIEVTVTNDGVVDLQLTSVSVAGANAGDFMLDPGTCAAAVLSPEQQCALSLRFSPTETGNRVAALVLVSNATDSPHTVTLGGTGVPPPPRTLNPTGLSFGRQPRGTTSPGQTITLTNNGSTPINIAEISLGGRDPDEFLITVNSCAPPFAVTPGVSCSVEVAFTPRAVGVHSAELTFVDDAPSSPQLLPLDGIGTGAALVFDPPELQFPKEQVGGFSERQDLTLTNVGNEPVSISSFTVSGDFRISGSCSGATLHPGAFCTARVVFAPTAPGQHTGQVTVVDTAGGASTAALRGTGGEPVPTIDPRALNFGKQSVGSTSLPQTITVTNTGTWPLTLHNVQMRGSNANDFLRGTSSCDGAVLRTGESCSEAIRFAPTGIGSRVAELSFTSNASATPHTVLVSGSGT